MELDFSGLDKLVYKGFDTEEERETRDRLLDQGFTFSQEKTPFEESGEVSNGAETASNTPPALHSINVPVKAQNAPQGKIRPLQSISGENYRAMYRAACNFHEKYNPATWAADLRNEDAASEYWLQAAEELGAVGGSCGGHPFLTALLTAVYLEMEDEYNQIKTGSL